MRTEDPMNGPMDGPMNDPIATRDDPVKTLVISE